MKNVRAKIECRDGFQFSVVANPDVRCSDPKRYWSDVEIGYPSNPDELLSEFASPGPTSRPPETYDYVPIKTLKDLVRKHGGVSIVTKWSRVCDRT